MPILRQLIQRIEQSAPQAGVLLFPEPHLLRDGIRSLEADSPDIVRKAVWILLHDFDAVVTVRLVDLRRVAGADIMALQKDHDVLDLHLLQPALLDTLHTGPSDAWNLQQPVRLILDNV